MRKIMIVTAMAALGLAFTLSEAAAQYRSNHGYRTHVAPRHYAPPVRQYHRPQRNWVPYAVGGLALGALGAGAYYYNNPTCWIETQDVYDRRGRYIGTQDVKVCR